MLKADSLSWAILGGEGRSSHNSHQEHRYKYPSILQCSLLVGQFAPHPHPPFTTSSIDITTSILMRSPHHQPWQQGPREGASYSEHKANSIYTLALPLLHRKPTPLVSVTNWNSSLCHHLFILVWSELSQFLALEISLTLFSQACPLPRA